MKTRFDLQSNSRKYQIGIYVLSFIPTISYLLSANIHGTLQNYESASKVPNNNYSLESPDRRKATQRLCINHMKSYYDSDQITPLLFSTTSQCKTRVPSRLSDTELFPRGLR